MVRADGGVSGPGSCAGTERALNGWKKNGPTTAVKNGRQKMTENKCCLNCKKHYPIPCLLQADDPECPYVRCSVSGEVVPKWADCDEWEEREDVDTGS